jgi:hypothetical protein
LIGDYRNEALINTFFNKEFSVIASRLGEDAGIIRQTLKSNVENELNEAIKKHQFNGTDVSNFFDTISHQYPGLLILKKHPDHLTEKDMIIHIPFQTLNKVYTDTEELLTDLVGFTYGRSQLIYKVNKWVRLAQKVISGFSVGLNIGFFAINYELK